MRRPARTLLATLLLGVLGAAASSGVPASAAAACSFDAGTATVAVTLGQGDSTTIARLGDAVAVDGTACDEATVTTTDRIDVMATGTPTELAIDLSGGRFAPGATDEGDGGSEIEFTIAFPAGSPTLRVIGSSGIDSIVVGDGGINLDATESVGDADVTITGNAAIVIVGGDGADILSVAGGSGTGGPAAATLRGGAGDDLLLGARGGTTFDGGDGTDTLDYSAAVQLTSADLSLGVVTHADATTDTVSALENLTGSPGDDTLVGDEGPNVLRGGDGNDTIEGGGGDDTLVGAAGVDTVRYSGAEGVVVDLRDGTASGDGDDVLSGFENVIGSPKPDQIHGDDRANTLVGAEGGDQIYGHGGADTIRGQNGPDRLFGQRGNDRLFGGPGYDELDGGKGNDDVCKGGPDPDSYVNCNNFRTRGA